jgi:hypothetical protein
LIKKLKVANNGIKKYIKRVQRTKFFGGYNVCPLIYPHEVWMTEVIPNLCPMLSGKTGCFGRICPSSV